MLIFTYFHQSIFNCKYKPIKTTKLRAKKPQRYPDIQEAKSALKNRKKWATFTVTVIWHQYYTELQLKTQMPQNSYINKYRLMENRTNHTEGTLNLDDYFRLLRDISKTIQEKYPKAVLSNQNGIVEMKNLEQMQEMLNENDQFDPRASKKGRGGNNVAENMKKSVKSILRKELSPQTYDYFDQNYIRKYRLKSQKENYVLYFLFLHEMLFEKRITAHVVETVIQQLRQRIRKYARGSEERIQSEPDREEFHLKNMREFRKFEQIDLDFSRPRNYSEIKDWIKGLYLKKQAVYLQAQRKVRSIIGRHLLIRKIFDEGEEWSQGSGVSNQAPVKSEYWSESDESGSE